MIPAFYAPRTIHRVTLEVEEPEVARTQKLRLAVSTDGGENDRELLRQKNNFSPPGTTSEREDWEGRDEAVTHLRLKIWPDKGASRAGRRSRRWP